MLSVRIKRGTVERSKAHTARWGASEHSFETVFWDILPIVAVGRSSSVKSHNPGFQSGTGRGRETPSPSRPFYRFDPLYPFWYSSTTMLMIRFQRIGRKNDAAFRMAVLPKASGPKAGKYVDLVGTYNPKTKAMTVDADKVKGWMSKGAQVSPSLMNLLVKNKVVEGTVSPKVVSKKNLEKNIKAAAEAAAKEAAAKAEADAKAAAAAEAEAKAAAEAAAAAPAEEAPAEAPTEEPAA